MKIIKIYDIETYPNFFSFVAKEPGSKKYDVFRLYTDKKNKQYNINEMSEFVKYLRNKNYIFVGFNNINFDAPVVEMILEKKGNVTNKQIFDLAQKLIDENNFRAKPHWKFKTKQIDLFRMWSFNTAQRQTSLKWLEFSMRTKKIKDMPLAFDKDVSKSRIPSIITYNKHDVDNTLALFNLSKDKLELRKIMAEKYKDFSFFSKGDVDMGADSFLYDLSKLTGENIYEIKKKRTYYKKLDLHNIIVKNKLLFSSPEFKKVLEKYENTTILPDEEGLLELKGAISYSMEFNNIEFNYGTGGLHASVKNGLFIADKDYLIIDVDVKSFYPNLAIVNKLYPKHLSMDFVYLYSKLYEERSKIPKSNPLNLSKKLSLNAIFGKSNSKYSYLYDSAFTLGITINGQLQLSMLVDQLSRISNIIQVNTDGVTIMIYKKNLKYFDKVLIWWQKKTGLVLERADYKQMAITDVNNYHAIYLDDKIKRKGKYAIYDDYIVIGKEEYHKNPSALIIPKSVNEYYINKFDKEKLRNVIYNETNIHEFLIGYKKKKNFEFMIAQPKESGYIDISKNSDRVIRYYVGIDGASIYKITDKLAITTLAKDTKLKLAQNLKSLDASDYLDLDRDYYYSEAREWIDEIELKKNKEFCYGK